MRVRNAERGTRNGFTPFHFAHKDLIKCGTRNNACASAECGTRNEERGTTSFRLRFTHKEKNNFKNALV